MNILIVHNAYGKYSGEEAVIEAHQKALKANGLSIKLFSRTSAELFDLPYGKVLGFFSALWNPNEVNRIRRILNTFRPDIVHIHNLYPLISPAILPVIKSAGIPIVMTVHNYRLICPNGLFYNQRGICESCANGNELYCVLNNCENSLPKSLGYALRAMVARVLKLYNNYVDVFFCLTEFQKNKLVCNGYEKQRCVVLPNFVDDIINEFNSYQNERSGVLFLGRLNRQKGIDILLKSAELCYDVSIYLAGEPDQTVIDVNDLPNNVKWLGVITGNHKRVALQRVSALVFTSRSYEGFPMVFLEAMQQVLPVIAPRQAGVPEIIREGYNGWLYEPNNPEDLARVIRYVSAHPDRARECGENGKRLLINEYSSKVWFEKYIDVINQCIDD